MNLDKFIKDSIKKPVQVQDRVFVYDGNGKIIEKHNTIDLGKAFFTMSNDVFFKVYGFNFVPQGGWWEKSKRAAGKM